MDSDDGDEPDVGHRDHPRRLPRIAGADLRWYGASAAIALGGAIIQLGWAQAHEKGLGVLVTCAGLMLSLLRLLLQRQAASTQQVLDRLAQLEGDLGLSAATLDPSAGYSRFASVMWDEAERVRADVRGEIIDGTVSVRGGPATVAVLRQLTTHADVSVHMVDLADIREWNSDPDLRDYLSVQLGRADRREIVVERIRVVREEDMFDAERRALLRDLVARHERARATILLCWASRLEQLSTVFGVQGMAFADRGHAPACVMGRIGRGDRLEGALMYLKDNQPMRTAIRDYDRLRASILHDDVDRRIRDQLSRPETRPKDTAADA